LKNAGPIRHCEPPHAACSNFTLPFTRCRYCRHHYQDEPKPAIAIGQAVSRATVATPGEWQCKIDVHNINDNNDNTWQRGPLWPHRRGPIIHASKTFDSRVAYSTIWQKGFQCYRRNDATKYRFELADMLFVEFTHWRNASVWQLSKAIYELIELCIHYSCSGKKRVLTSFSFSFWTYGSTVIYGLDSESQTYKTYLLTKTSFIKS